MYNIIRNEESGEISILPRLPNATDRVGSTINHPYRSFNGSVKDRYYTLVAIARTQEHAQKLRRLHMLDFSRFAELNVKGAMDDD